MTTVINSYPAGSVLNIKTKIPRFYLKQGSFTCNKLMRSFKTIWGSCVFRARPSVPVKKIANGDIWFSQRETGAKIVAMATT